MNLDNCAPLKCGVQTLRVRPFDAEDLQPNEIMNKRQRLMPPTVIGTQPPPRKRVQAPTPSLPKPRLTGSNNVPLAPRNSLVHQGINRQPQPRHPATVKKQDLKRPTPTGPRAMQQPQQSARPTLLDNVDPRRDFPSDSSQCAFPQAQGRPQAFDTFSAPQFIAAMMNGSTTVSLPFPPTPIPFSESDRADPESSPSGSDSSDDLPFLHPIFNALKLAAMSSHSLSGMTSGQLYEHNDAIYHRQPTYSELSAGFLSGPLYTIDPEPRQDTDPTPSEHQVKEEASSPPLLAKSLFTPEPEPVAPTAEHQVKGEPSSPPLLAKSLFTPEPEPVATSPSLTEEPSSPPLLGQSLFTPEPEPAATLPASKEEPSSPPLLAMSLFTPEPDLAPTPTPTPPPSTEPQTLYEQSPAPEIKQERFSPMPDPIPQSSRITTGTHRVYPLPQNCVKAASNPDFSRHRIRWSKTEIEGFKTEIRSRFRSWLKTHPDHPEVKFRIDRWMVREDGLIIDWTCSCPLWSDTLRPATPDPDDPATAELTSTVDVIEIVEDEPDVPPVAPLNIAARLAALPQDTPYTVPLPGSVPPSLEARRGHLNPPLPFVKPSHVAHKPQNPDVNAPSVHVPSDGARTKSRVIPHGTRRIALFSNDRVNPRPERPPEIISTVSGRG